MAGSPTRVLVSLPRPLTSLIGRETELTHLYELLRSDVALVTITGFGGIGKTRLSLQAALELEPIFDAGAIFTSLASVTQSSSIPRAIAQTAGLDDSIDTVSDLTDALGPASRLLVLDNLEQIPDAAEMVLSLIQAMPNTTVLATSRNQLDLRGEYVLPLEPLETQSDDPRSLPSVQLFIERGKATAPALPTDDASVAIIAEICHKLDGIPLAIELAAARLAIFSLTDLRDQLTNILPVLASKRVDMPDRQRTMRNAIAWTYELLEEFERRLFTWLSVYEQDFSLESVAHVAHQLELTDDPLDLVQFLVSRSLIRPSRREAEAPRYQMLQMLREFGHEHLLVMNEDYLARRSHAHQMVALTERAEPLLTTAESGEASRHLNDDIANIYGALRWSNQQNLPEFGQRIFAAIWRYFENTGQVERALAYVPDTSEGTADDITRARALIGIGYLHERIRNLAPALNAFTNAKEIAENLSDQTPHVRALTGMGTVQFDYSNVPLSQQYLTEAQQLAERIGDTRGQMTSAGMLSIIDIQLGNFEEAIAGYKPLMKLAEEMGDATSLSTLTLNTALCYQNLDRPHDAQEMLLRGLEISKESDDVTGMCIAYANLSGNSTKLGMFDECLKYGNSGLELAREAGLKNIEAALLINLSSVKHRQQDFGASASMAAQASKLMDFDGGAKEQIHFASVITEICIELDLHEDAAELLGAVFSMREKLQVVNRDARADAEDEAMEIIDPENTPAHAAALRRGAELDRSSLVQRIQELSTKIVAIQPPATPVPDEPEPTPAYKLTPREYEVMQLLAQGHTNDEIAEGMFVSTRTVTTHISNIFNKLDVNNRARAIAVATQAGLVADR